MRTIVQIIGSVLLLAGAVACIVGRQCVFAPWVFGAGALVMAALAVADMWQHRDASFREARLFRLNLLASLVLAAGAVLMYKGSNSWVACLMVYALVTLFLSFRFKQ